MQFFQGYLYALRLKPQKEALLRRWVGCRRWVSNEALGVPACGTGGRPRAADSSP
jgi:hypothetical protein